MSTKDETPMMVQYHQIKDQYPDTFVFYRLGDFFELFEDDAIKGAKLLELTLTSRNKNSKNPVPMAGIPHHAAQNYIDILVDQGYKVAIVEQMSDPATSKGMVDREVVQLITPGTKLSSGAGGQDGKENNYLAALWPSDGRWSLSYVDLSTGELKVTTIEEAADILDELSALEVKEVVFPKDVSGTNSQELVNQLGQRGVLVSYQSQGEPNAEISYLTQGLDQSGEQAGTAMLLHYLFNTQRRNLDHIMPAQCYERLAYLKFNDSTRKNLDLVENARTQKKAGSLLGLIDQTKTAMGGRMLKQWLLRPLRNLDDIQERLDLVERFQADFFRRGAIQDQLKSVYDLERLAARAAMGTLNARELVQLRRSLSTIPTIKAELAGSDDPLLQQLNQSLDDMTDITSLIEAAIVDDPPVSVREGDIIRPGFDEQIDQYRQVLTDNQQWLSELERSEREVTGINSLKVGYNKNFGYFIEVTKANIDKLAPDRYQRRQTLTNAERFITPDLKEHEQLITEAQVKLQQVEYDRFVAVRDRVKAEIQRIQGLASRVARLDVLTALADVADNLNLVRPEFHTDSNAIHVEQGRHPVVESLLEAGEFIANDIDMPADVQIQLITGPNMAGKSTYMRELALIVILAQIGSFVPAQRAQLPIFDQIFTRIGASDDLVNGQSTFMVEMAEAEQAIAGATQQSLILFDELGRGTATYDGIALAQAIIEYLDQHVHAKTLFSTHYHELTTLAEQYPGIENVHVGASLDDQGHLHFLHQIAPGPADRSYGIHVAALAGLPRELIQNANQILGHLESQNGLDEAGSSQPISLFEMPAISEAQEEVLAQVAQLDLSNMTPLEALNTLAKLQELGGDHAQDS